MRFVHLLLFGLVLTGPASAQEVTSDCFREDLVGPVAHVEVTQVRYEAEDGALVEGEPRVIRREEYDDKCDLVAREHVGDMVYAYWDDEDGRGRRFDFKFLDNPDRVMVTVPSGEPPVPEAKRERGTLRESAYDPEARVLTVTLSQSGRLRQRFVYTLDPEMRVVHEVMTDSDGFRSYEATSVFDASGTEEVVDYEHPTTAVRLTASAGRRLYRFADPDGRGNWTRRATYRWEDGGWVPVRVHVRAITYRDDERP